MKHYRDCIDEIAALAEFQAGLSVGLRAAGDSESAEKAQASAKWLGALSQRICAGEIIGCYGGHECESDHK